MDINYNKEYSAYSELVLSSHLKGEDNMLLGGLTDATKNMWGPLYQGSGAVRWKCHRL